MNRQRYMAELSKLLSFMFKEDRSEILQHYNELLDNAEDEDALLEEFGSPTKLAVTIFRNYEREDLKLSVNAESKDGSIEEPEFSRPSAGQFRTYKASSPEEETPEEEITSASYVDIIEEIRREIAEENGTEYVPIFFDELDEDKIDVQEPAEAEVEEPEPEAEPEVEEIPEVEEAPAVEEISESEEAPAVEEAPGAEESSEGEEVPVIEETPEVEAVPEVEEPAEGSAEEPEETAEELEPVEESEPAEPSEEEEIPEPATEEDADASEPEPVSGETEPVAEENAPEVEETVTEPTVEEALPETEETVTEPVLEEPEEFIPDEPEYETEGEKKLSAGLLILYLIFAIPIGLVLLIALAAVTLAVLGCAVAAIAGGVLLVSFALSGIAVAADMILILGGALVAFAIGLLLVWTGFWLILAAFHGLVNLIIRLGGRICMKEAAR